MLKPEMLEIYFVDWMCANSFYLCACVCSWIWIYFSLIFYIPCLFMCGLWFCQFKMCLALLETINLMWVMGFINKLYQVFIFSRTSQPKNLKVDTALSPLLSNKLTKFEVDQMNSYWENWRTDRQTEISGFIVRYMSINELTEQRISNVLLDTEAWSRPEIRTEEEETRMLSRSSWSWDPVLDLSSLRTDRQRGQQVL